MTGKRHSVTDYYILVGNDIAERDILARKYILIENGIFDYCIFAYLHSAEKNAVFHRAVNAAAVGNERILDLGIRTVICGRRVTYLCIYRTALYLKKLAVSLSIGDKLHIVAEIIAHRRDT